MPCGGRGGIIPGAAPGSPIGAGIAMLGWVCAAIARGTKTVMRFFSSLDRLDQKSSADATPVVLPLALDDEGLFDVPLFWFPEEPLALDDPKLFCCWPPEPLLPSVVAPVSMPVPEPEPVLLLAWVCPSLE